MRIVHLSADRAVAAVVESLGFDGTAADLTAPEVLASAVRRAASFMCPATPRKLVAAVRGSVAGLAKDPDDEASLPLRATVDSLAAYGDLIRCVGPAIERASESWTEARISGFALAPPCRGSGGRRRAADEARRSASVIGAADRSNSNERRTRAFSARATGSRSRARSSQRLR